jgi:hypothetical protein
MRILFTGSETVKSRDTEALRMAPAKREWS